MENKFYDTLNRYFKRLSQVGYIPDNDVYSILIYTYISDIKKNTELTKGEENIINNAINCLQGTCLFPYGSCNKICI